MLKRLDTILEEIHTDLTDGWGVDTRLAGTSFINTLVTTFGNQIASLWETAQDSYYSKYPATATELNLDHAVQYGGIKRSGDKRTSYVLHCTGDDGTYVRENAIVATNTKPEIRLFSAEEFQITRERFNKVSVIVASEDVGVYTISINGDQYSYSNPTGGKSEAILAGLASAITDNGFTGRIRLSLRTRQRPGRASSRSRITLRHPASLPWRISLRMTMGKSPCLITSSLRW